MLFLNSPSKDGGNGDKYGESAIEIHLKMKMWSIVFIIFEKKNAIFERNRQNTMILVLLKLNLITNIQRTIMPFISVNIHFVWSTKNRMPFLGTHDQRRALWLHIKENAEKKDIYIDFVNGYTDHCHCLVSLAADQTMSKVMQLIKGESSFWVNKTQLCAQKFEWQDEYFAVSVSQSQLVTVRNYIKNQEQHHHKKTFQDEYDEFMLRYGFQKFKDEL